MKVNVYSFEFTQSYFSTVEFETESPRLELAHSTVFLHNSVIGIFESQKCDVNPQPNTLSIGPLVGRTSGNHRSVMNVLAVILSITCHFIFIVKIFSFRLYGLVEKYVQWIQVYFLYFN